MKKGSYSLQFIACFLILLITSSCDNSLDPLNKNKGIYSIYGYVNINDTSYIRVKNLNVPNIKDSAGTINGTVTLTNLENGVTTVLHDTTVVFDGVVTHNFVVARDILPLTTYRIKAVREDGRMTAAKATTPNAVNFEISPDLSKYACKSPITFSFAPIHSETFIVVRIKFNYLYGSVNRTLLHEIILRPIPGYYGRSFTRSPYDIIYDTVCGLQRNCSVRCSLLSPPVLHLTYYHYGPNSDFAIDDKFSIPGGVGTFLGMGVGTKSLRVFGEQN